ncbi:hypothetical protein J1N35_002571 [Gossypium stocksii]|uniref:Uncharacterized protein n=1 Tax=Gossypium stocksii TaxID=47602 RepID=A0A9D4ANN1_9ROSI|nr:hypothetical protein J1N35_002571 [Gossypium stocksii]
MIQGSKFDPEGEYVRAVGVELRLNYLKPIIDISTTREHLRETVYKKWEMEADAKAATSDGMNEEVFDNSVDIEANAIPKAILQ